MVGVASLAGDDRVGSEGIADPDLVDAVEGEVVDDRVPPPGARFPEAVLEARPQETEDGVAGRGVEVATDDERD